MQIILNIKINFFFNLMNWKIIFLFFQNYRPKILILQSFKIINLK